MNKAIFAFKNDDVPQKTDLLPNKVELFKKLEDRDVEPVVSLNAEDAFFNESVNVSRLINETSAEVAGSIALSEVGVVVNRLDRSIKNEAMPDAWQSSDIAVMNANELRSLVFRKHRVQDEVLEPLNLGISSVLVDTIADAAVFMELNPAGEYILKPTSGTFSKGVMRLDQDGVIRALEDEALLGKTLIQPAYDFSKPLPNNFQAYDATARPDFDAWAKSNVTKELRMYGFYTPEKTDVFAVGRAMQNGQDNWFFMDPDSVPEKLIDDTENVLSRAAQLTSSKAIYGALDIGYGSKSSEEAPDYHVVELNGRMPYLVGYDKHAAVADKLRDLKADQIQRVIQREDPK